MGATIGAFLLANWYWFLIAIVALIFLEWLGKLFKITGLALKIIFFPFWLIYSILKPVFKSIKYARAERKAAERID